MLDISPTELLVIAVVALIVFGPQRLPEIARKAGKWSREIRAIAREFRAGIEREVAEIEKPVREMIKDVKEPIQGVIADIQEPLNAAADELSSATPTEPLKWVGPQSPTGPTAQDAARDLKRIDEGLDPEDGQDE